jgi:hypothetical protein
MFRAPPRPSSGAQQQPLVLPLERGGSSPVGRGRAGQTTTNNAATTNAPTVQPEAVNAVVSS